MSTPCPTCGRDDASASQPNSSGDLHLAVPEALIPAMAHAMAYAYTCAWMSKAPEAEAIFDELQKTVRAAKPVAAGHFEDYQWASLLTRITAGNEITIAFSCEGEYYQRNFHVRITDASGKAWPGGTLDDPAVMVSPMLDTKDEAQELCDELKALQDRLRPL